MVIVLLVLFIFSIIGVNLLKGTSFYCDTDAITGLGKKQLEMLIFTRHDCLNYGGEWILRPDNYDNLGNAMIQIILMALNINIPNSMYNSMNSSKNGPEYVPR